MKHFIISSVVAIVALGCSRQPDFYLGVDMGWLTEYESWGWTAHDTLGNERECMELMGTDYGVNAERVRVWVDPSAHANWCGLQDVINKCLRAKSLKQEVMIDFHYSDWWADPSKQNIPKGWRGHPFDEMKADLARHTVDVLEALKQHGVKPRWVQVGNETSNGMLWSVQTDSLTGWEIKGDDGKTIITETMGHLERDPQQYAGFFKAGYDAVKSVFPDAIVIVHLDNGFDNDLYNRNLDTLIEGGAQFDMIGMSLYPYWSMLDGKMPDAATTITNCIANINKLVAKYDVDVMITETGYEVDELHPEVMEAGRDQLERLIRECRTMTNGRCKGVFYWEPECLPSQYKLGAFTSDGRPTVIMDAYKSGMVD